MAHAASGLAPFSTYVKAADWIEGQTAPRNTKLDDRLPFSYLKSPGVVVSAEAKRGTSLGLLVDTVQQMSDAAGFVGRNLLAYVLTGRPHPRLQRARASIRVVGFPRASPNRTALVERRLATLTLEESDVDGRQMRKLTQDLRATLGLARYKPRPEREQRIAAVRAVLNKQERLMPSSRYNQEFWQAVTDELGTKQSWHAVARAYWRYPDPLLPSLDGNGHGGRPRTRSAR